MRKKVLIVDDRQDYLASLQAALARDYDVTTASTVEEARAAFTNDLAAALLDIRLVENDPGNVDGLRLLEWLKQQRADLPVIMMSAYREFELAVHALNLGASYFLRKPIALAEVRTVLEAFTNPETSAEQISRLRAQSFGVSREECE